MIDAGELEEIRSQLPDDLAGDFDDVASALQLSIRQVRAEAERVFASCRHLASDRKAFALAAKNEASSRALPLVFAMLDGRDPGPLALKAVRIEVRS